MKPHHYLYLLTMLACPSLWAWSEPAKGYVELSEFGDPPSFLFESSSKKTMEWSLTGLATEAAAGYSAKGTGWASSKAGTPGSRESASDLWAGDLLTFKVAGAGSDTLTTIKFSCSFKAVLVVVGDTNVQAYAGLGLGGLSGGASVLLLPEPFGVVEFPPCDGSFSNETGGYSNTKTIEVVIRGPYAIVPLWFRVGAGTTGVATTSAHADFKWSIKKLPAGVSCTSRSGAVPRCPAAN